MAATTLQTLTQAKFSGYDFDTISDNLRAQLQIQFASNYNDFAASALGIVLLDSVAFGLDTLSFYLDRRATETYLQTALTRGAVARLTRQLGYKMAAATAASIDLSITIANPGFNVPLPSGFQFQGPNGLIFETSQTVTWLSSDSARTKTVTCYEGLSFTENFVSDGTANQVFTLQSVPSGMNLVAGSVDILVNGTSWVESVFLSFDQTNQFEVGYNDSPPTIRFGNGAAGNIPTTSATIQVSYIATHGAAGQVTSGGAITSPVSPLIVSFTAIQMTVTSPFPTIGGNPPEDLTHAKTFAPLVFKSRQVAITQPDYVALAGSFSDPLFGRVAEAQAYSTRSASADLELQNQLSIIEAVQVEPLAVAGTRMDTYSSSLPQPTYDGTAIADARARLRTIQNDVDAVTSTLTLLSGNTSLINSTSVSMLGASTPTPYGARGANTVSMEVQSDAADASTYAVQALTDSTSGLNTTAITVGPGPNALTTATFDFLTSLLNNINSKVTTIRGNGSTIQGLTNTLVNNVATIQTAVAAVGLTPTDAGSQLLAVTNSMADVTSQVGAGSLPATYATVPVSFQFSTPPHSSTPAPEVYPSTALGSLAGDLSAIQGIEVDSTSTVDGACQVIQDHVDAILSADCQANLVTVPILATDASGFYTKPTFGLINSLQTYLNSICEVTQTPSVVDGSSSLVPAVINIVEWGYKHGYSQSVVTTSVYTAIDGLLTGRAFGESLYISDISTAILAVPGTDFVNIQIQGSYISFGSTSLTTSLLDSQGNLIIANNQVVTKGAVTVSTPVLVTS